MSASALTYGSRSHRWTRESGSRYIGGLRRCLLPRAAPRTRSYSASASARQATAFGCDGRSFRLAARAVGQERARTRRVPSTGAVASWRVRASAASSACARSPLVHSQTRICAPLSPTVDVRSLLPRAASASDHRAPTEPVSGSQPCQVATSCACRTRRARSVQTRTRTPEVAAAEFVHPCGASSGMCGQSGGHRPQRVAARRVGPVPVPVARNASTSSRRTRPAASAGRSAASPISATAGPVRPAGEGEDVVQRDVRPVEPSRCAVERVRGGGRTSSRAEGRHRAGRGVHRFDAEVFFGPAGPARGDLRSPPPRPAPPHRPTTTRRGATSSIQIAFPQRGQRRGPVPADAGLGRHQVDGAAARVHAASHMSPLIGP